jgi:Do/DeqQ family serine protease
MSKTNFFGSNKLLIINIALIGIIIGFFLGIFSFSCSTKIDAGDKVYAQDDLSEEGISTLESIQYSFRQVAEKVLPVVVEISTIDIIEQSVPESPFDFFFSPDEGDGQEKREFRRSGLGSGVIVRKEGNTVYVLTNHHVVGEAEEITVTLYNDSRDFDATLIGGDERMDLALISFESNEDIPVADLGDSDDLYVGDWVLAVGNPFGFESTVTAGIISALGRQYSPGTNISDFIQTDAAINPGNSGGALVNIHGQVIGINTWIASETGVNMGYGFAIPINNAKNAIEDFIQFGKIEYAWLGVSIITPEDELKPLAEDLQIEGKEGALVLQVYNNSPAGKGGMLPGDFIIELNGEKIRDHLHLTRLVGAQKPGEKAEFKVIRLGQTLTLTVTLSVRAEEKEILTQSKNLWPGLMVFPLTPDLISQLNIRGQEGVIIYNVLEGTPAYIARFQAGDIITYINDKPVMNVMDFYRILNDNNYEELRFTIVREGNEISLGLRR